MELEKYETSQHDQHFYSNFFMPVIIWVDFYFLY